MPCLRCILLVSLAALTACSSTLMAYKDTLEVAYFGLPDANFTPEQIRQSPQDIVYATVPGGPRVSLAQELATSNTVTWGSLDHAALVFVGTRLARTTGFASNLLHVAPPRMQTNTSIDLNSMVGQHSQLQVLHQDARFSDVIWQSEVVHKQSVAFEYDGFAVPAVEIEERLSSVQLGMELTQRYWFDAQSGALLRTIQQLSPAMTEFDVVFISALVRVAQPPQGH